MRINLPSRKYSIYKQRKSLGKCEACCQYRICYEAWEIIGVDDDGHQDVMPYWTCKKDMSNEQYEHYFV